MKPWLKGALIFEGINLIGLLLSSIYIIGISYNSFNMTNVVNFLADFLNSILLYIVIRNSILSFIFGAIVGLIVGILKTKLHFSPPTKWNWKKIGLFLLFVIVGVFFFGVISILTMYISLLSLIFFIVSLILLVLIVKQYTKTKMILIITLILIYLLIMVIPFPLCSSSGSFSSEEKKECTCIGLEKYSFGVYDASWSQCVGIPINERSEKQWIE